MTRQKRHTLEGTPTDYEEERSMSTQASPTPKVINCECGAVVRAASDDDLVEQVTQHVEQAHPELIGKMSRDDILAMAEEAL